VMLLYGCTTADENPAAVVKLSFGRKLASHIHCGRLHLAPH